MKVIIAGGGYDGKRSGVIDKIGEQFAGADVCTVVNGGELPDISGFDLVLWMPDVSNDEEKQYPVKDRGTVLICSKVMREGYTLMDAVTRIFKMHGNAVIAIHKEPGKKFKFELVDALGHIWYIGYGIEELCHTISDLYHWTKGAIRKSVPKADSTVNGAISGINLEPFMELNRELALKSAAQCGNRFFGNFSTRCTKLFPSHRYGELIIMSPRNVDKRTLKPDDMVPIVDGAYIGDRKPSVDAPVQLVIYNRMPKINFMIHGHAHAVGMPTTKDYYPCGDMREIPETVELLRDGHKAVNLRNHGFLLATETLEEMQELKNSLNFEKITDF
jgi:hypothetical protein